MLVAVFCPYTLTLKRQPTWSSHNYKNELYQVGNIDAYFFYVFTIQWSLWNVCVCPVLSGFIIVAGNRGNLFSQNTEPRPVRCWQNKIFCAIPVATKYINYDPTISGRSLQWNYWLTIIAWLLQAFSEIVKRKLCSITVSVYLGVVSKGSRGKGSRGKGSRGKGSRGKGQVSVCNCHNIFSLTACISWLMFTQCWHNKPYI